MVNLDKEFEVNWKFRVKAVNQEQANLKVEATMIEFAKFMGWEEPEALMRIDPPAAPKNDTVMKGAC